LENFRHYGIVVVKKKKSSKRFYVTPLMKCLFEDMTSIFERQENYKFIMVETNFKVYAYTNSIFETKILEFLLEIEYVFPGFLVGHITRNSIRKVLKRGVSHQKVFVAKVIFRFFII
jgi:transcription initiation factor TFIIH subunit 4